MTKILIKQINNEVHYLREDGYILITVHIKEEDKARKHVEGLYGEVEYIRLRISVD